MAKIVKELPFTVELPENSEHLNMIIYGDTGTGKTYLCGSALDFEGSSPTLFIDFEGGTKTLHGRKIDVVRPKNWKEIQTIYEYLYHDNEKYKSVVIDSLTELQKKFSMGAIMGQFDEDNNNYADLENSVAPTRQDWLRSGEQMRKTIRAFRDLAYLQETSRRVHVIMTALEKYDEKKRIICPSLPGSLAYECGALVDIFARLSKQAVTVINPETKEEKVITRRHLLTEEHVDETDLKYTAKNRGGRLGKQMWDPTIAKILGVWKENPKDDL